MTTRVVRAITRLNVGGPSIQALTLTERLSARGYPTTLVHGRLGPGEGDMRYIMEGRSLDLRYLPALRRALSPWHDVRAFAQIFAILWTVRPAILHTHMAKAGTLGRMAGAACNLLRPGRRIRMVHTYHGHVLEGYFSGWKTRLFIEIERRLARVTDRLIAISPTIKSELVEQFGVGSADQYEVVPLGFDLAPFAAVPAEERARTRTELGIAPGTPVVTTVGRLTAIKQHDLFLEGARRLVAEGRDIVFLIAGDGEQRANLELHAASAGLSGRVRFLGWWRELPRLYAATDVFVLTSRNEGTPVALIEAMASGVPGVATNVGGVRDVIADASLGVLVPFGDPEALAAAVGRLLDAPDERQAMGSRAQSAVVERFGLERLVHDMTGVYQFLEARR